MTIGERGTVALSAVALLGMGALVGSTYGAGHSRSTVDDRFNYMTFDGSFTQPKWIRKTLDDGRSAAIMSPQVEGYCGSWMTVEGNYSHYRNPFIHLLEATIEANPDYEKTADLRKLLETVKVSGLQEFSIGRSWRDAPWETISLDDGLVKVKFDEDCDLFTLDVGESSSRENPATSNAGEAHFRSDYAGHAVQGDWGYDRLARPEGLSAALDSIVKLVRVDMQSIRDVNGGRPFSCEKYERETAIW